MMMTSPAFWHYTERLLHEHQLIIDRPHGATHPRYPDKIYPLDYGYLEGTTGGDGVGIDVWRGTDGSQLVGVLCTVDVDKHDMEIKLLVGCTADEVRRVVQFLNMGTMACFVVWRSDQAR